MAVLPFIVRKARTAKCCGSIDPVAQDFDVTYDESVIWKNAIVVRMKWYSIMCDCGFDTLNDQAVTVRHHDTMEQERISIKELNQYVQNKLKIFKGDMNITETASKNPSGPAREIRVFFFCHRNRWQRKMKNTLGKGCESCKWLPWKFQFLQFTISTEICTHFYEMGGKLPDWVKVGGKL